MGQYLENMSVHIKTVIIVVIFLITNVVAVMTTYNALNNKLDQTIIGITHVVNIVNNNTDRVLALEKRVFRKE